MILNTQRINDRSEICELCNNSRPAIRYINLISLYNYLMNFYFKIEIDFKYSKCPYSFYFFIIIF